MIYFIPGGNLAITSVVAYMSYTYMKKWFLGQEKEI